MTLANGRHYLAIPGPSVAPDEVLQAMHRAAPNIYEGELIDMVPGIATDLKKVARTTGQVAIYIPTGMGFGRPRWSTLITLGIGRWFWRLGGLDTVGRRLAKALESRAILSNLDGPRRWILRKSNTLCARTKTKPTHRFW